MKIYNTYMCNKLTCFHRINLLYALQKIDKKVSWNEDNTMIHDIQWL